MTRVYGALAKQIRGVDATAKQTTILKAMVANNPKAHGTIAKVWIEQNLAGPPGDLSRVVGDRDAVQEYFDRTQHLPIAAKMVIAPPNSR